MLSEEEIKSPKDPVGDGRNPPPKTKNTPKRPYKRKQNQNQYDEECQPTSSKVKVEDLVTDEDERNTHPPQKQKDPVRKQFPYKDRPIAKPNLAWPYDPRMPKSWNEVAANMYDEIVAAESGHYPDNPDELDGIQSNPADDWELGPFEFTRERYPNEKHREFLRRTLDITPELGGTDESILKIDNLRLKYNQPRGTANRTPKAARKTPPDGKTWTGKRRAATNGLTEADIPRLRAQWFEDYADMVQGVPECMPPFREVNHEIPTVDDKVRYRYHLPRCPHSLREEFREKTNRYVRAGWWEPCAASQAAPMLCLPKKDGHLRTVVDLRQRNDNTVKDVTPMPDQDNIREDVARAKYRSKIDLSDAYEQVRVILRDVPKSAFATIMGTYVSHVMQQGDCNAPATFQRLMTAIFRDLIGVSMHVYLDDLFVFSDTIEDHQRHLGEVFERLRKHSLYLKASKCDLYAERMDCLGHVIDDQGLHADADKLARIREWRTPRNYHDIQKFVGLVQYLAAFLPDITAYTGPLMSMTQNGNAFLWRPLHQRCFDMIKHICCKTAILKPIDPKTDEPIWVICDASKTGVGAMYGQGPTWQSCRPAGFLSKKFTSAQQNYRVFEQETLAILEALLKWEDKLIGYRIHVITDHRALEFFKTQARLSSRQTRWMDYMSRFDFDITYIEGKKNKVADALSRYYEFDTWDEVHSFMDYVHADIRIDPGGDDLPADRYREVAERVVELRAAREANRRKSRRLQERQEVREIEALEMEEAAERASNQPGDDDPADSDITVGEMLNAGPDRNPRQDLDDGFLKAIKTGYREDSLFSKVLGSPNDYPHFVIKDKLIWTKNVQDDEVLCIPSTNFGEQSLAGVIIDQAHRAVGHFGAQRTSEYIRRWYWWPKVYGNTFSYCKSCEACQRAKGNSQKPAGKLHTLPLPTKPWDSIGMDFVGPFPESKGYNYLWVIVCRMTAMVHLIPVHTKMKASELSWIYRREIVRLHGLPSSIVSDRDSKFTSKWWRELHRILGSKLLMSTSFHPQTDGLTERMNRSVGQIFRTDLRPDQKDWVDRVDMTEFAINASISDTTRYAPFELNGGHLPSMIREIRVPGAIPPGIKSFARQALINLADAHDSLIESRVFQTYYANKRRRSEPKILVGDLVYLSTKNLNLPKGRASKLCPKFVGPYKVLKAHPDTSNYTLELPAALASRRIHPTFHVGLLRPHHPNNDSLFPNRAHAEPYDFGAPDDAEWFVDEILGHRRDGQGKLEFEVRWSLGDTTWEPHQNCKELEALDRYLELMGVKYPRQLARVDRDRGHVA